MPIYEYECRSCKQRHEVMQKMLDAPLTTCEGCGGEVYRLISPSGLSFKGEGFYITDYARKGKDQDSKTDSKTDSKKEPVAASTTPSTTTTSGEKTGEKPSEKKETVQNPSAEKTKTSEKKDLPKEK